MTSTTTYGADSDEPDPRVTERQILHRIYDQVDKLPLITPVSARASAVADLLPDLRALIESGSVEPGSMANTVCKATIYLDPRVTRLADPVEALQRLEDIVNLTGGVRSPGRPGIGPDTKVALTHHTYAWLDAKAHGWGLLRAGQPNRSAAIRRIVEEAQRVDER